MPRNSTFLRFTTRGLLLVMLGLSVVLAIAFSLLPPLLQITRFQLAVGLGWYVLGFLLLSGFACLWRLRTERKSGPCLLSLQLEMPTQRPPHQPALACLKVSGLYLWLGSGPLARNDMYWTAVMLTMAGLAGAAAVLWLVWGRLICGIELREHGIVRACGRFFSWSTVQTRGVNSSGSAPPPLEFYLAAKLYRPKLSGTDREAVEAILARKAPVTHSSVTVT